MGKATLTGLQGPVEIDSKDVTGIYDEGANRAIQLGRGESRPGSKDTKGDHEYVKVKETMAEIHAALGDPLAAAAQPQRKPAPAGNITA